jgi:tetratricopeptide (TPR) repeat protein
MPRSRFVVAGLLAVALPAVALACLWDYDTLKQERARFPDTLELITGKFLRHSKEFYEWRIQDRLKKLQSDPKNLGYYDDLAVAYDKTGQHDKAIETMLAKEKLKPGLYETYANLGTFYFHSGKLEEGLPYIDKALAINSDAHFGRERDQKWLVEYVREVQVARDKKGAPTLPLRQGSIDPREPGDRAREFAWFVRAKLGKQSLELEDVRPAVKGLLGMMRFGHFDSPVLLEALGDVLSPPSFAMDVTVDAKRLAARAYLKASYEVKDEAAKRAYRDFAERILKAFQTSDPNIQELLSLSDLEARFRQELADAEQWYADLRERELGWIRDGKDPESEFDHLYADEPRVPGEPSDDHERSGFRLSWRPALFWIVVLFALVSGVYIIRRLVRGLPPPPTAKV